MRRPRPGRGGASSSSASSSRYSLRRVEVVAEQRALAGELLAVALELALERDDVAVGVELRERQVEQVVRLDVGYRRTRLAAML